MADFLDGFFELNPTFAVSQGKHEFDGQLPDFSEAGLQAQIDYRQSMIEAVFVGQGAPAQPSLKLTYAGEILRFEGVEGQDALATRAPMSSASSSARGPSARRRADSDSPSTSCMTK